ncbi:MAG TPA: 3'(2'),5'-bisphosphate nucleotidase [Gammaproteobacteria bacterium]|nr:3'(2'),5'-bisphosphate nucleotidase [Gammaproteobacteria bacterium]
MDQNPCNYLDSVAEIATRAGAAIMDIYQQDFDVQHKGDGSPLTQADLAAHNLIKEALQKLTPELPLLSEESRDISWQERSGWHTYWLVDPLDGTKEFVNRNGEFTVNIALISGNRPVLGVVYAPVYDILYTGCEGVAATRTEKNGPVKKIAVRHYTGSRPTVVASRSHRGEALDHAIKRINETQGEAEILSMGSSFKLCLVAEGKADIYPRLGLTSEWDTAAAHAVVNAAGGRVTNLDGKELQYNKKDLLNPWFVVSDSDYDWLPLINDPRQNDAPQ